MLLPIYGADGVHFNVIVEIKYFAVGENELGIKRMEATQLLNSLMSVQHQMTLVAPTIGR